MKEILQKRLLSKNEEKTKRQELPGLDPWPPWPPLWILLNFPKLTNFREKTRIFIEFIEKHGLYSLILPGNLLDLGLAFLGLPGLLSEFY